MVIKQEMFVYAIKDANGLAWMGAVDRAEQVIRVTLQDDPQGYKREWVGASYELPYWCLKNELQCLVTKRTIEVEFPDMTTE